MNIAYILTTVTHIKMGGREADLNLPEAMSWSRHYPASGSFDGGWMSSSSFVHDQLVSEAREVDLW